jgi:hypothetical protein
MKDTSAKTMTNQERARKAVNERWHSTLPRSKHSGILNIAGQEIACDVLQDGRRVLRHGTFARAMGKAKAKSEDVERANALKIPVFVSANNLTPYLEPIISERGEQILYKGIDGRRFIGYDASLLPEACKVYVRADDAGILQKQQKPVAQVCRSMLYGLASVGISALIDECTGYQEFRERNELQQILNKYISEELREWTKKFPNEFFKQIYRIHNWEYPKIGNHPQCIGKFINKYIYGKLPEGILDELMKKNPSNEYGNRKYRHHQFLSEDIGDDNLKKQIVQTITVMKLSNNIDQFKEFIEKIS